MNVAVLKWVWPERSTCNLIAYRNLVPATNVSQSQLKLVLTHG